MIHTTYITPKTTIDKPVSSAIKPSTIHKKKKHVTVSVYEPQRTPIRVNEIFLNICRKEYASVEVVMNTGEIIEGIIDCYDQDTIVLHNDLAQLLIYKNGMRIYIGEKHNGTYVENEEQIRMLYLGYSGL